MAVYFIIDFTVKLVASFKGQYCVYNHYVGDAYLWEVYPPLSFVTKWWTFKSCLFCSPLH